MKRQETHYICKSYVILLYSLCKTLGTINVNVILAQIAKQ